MRGNIAISILGLFSLSLSLFGCNSISQERKIEFVYLALGASDTTGVGATPVTEGYVYLVNRDLQQRISGTFLINFGVPGARIDSLIEQVRLAKHVRSKAKLATVWPGPMTLCTAMTLHGFRATSGSSFARYRVKYPRLW